MNSFGTCSINLFLLAVRLNFRSRKNLLDAPFKLIFSKLNKEALFWLAAAEKE
jgi:hypothetical protein